MQQTILPTSALSWHPKPLDEILLFLPEAKDISIEDAHDEETDELDDEDNFSTILAPNTQPLFQPDTPEPISSSQPSQPSASITSPNKRHGTSGHALTTPLELHHSWDVDVIVQNVAILDKMLLGKGLLPFGPSLQSLATGYEAMLSYPMPGAPTKLDPYKGYRLVEDIPMVSVQDRVMRELFGPGAEKLGWEDKRPKNPDKPAVKKLRKKQNARLKAKNPPGGTRGLPRIESESEDGPDKSISAEEEAVTKESEPTANRYLTIKTRAQSDISISSDGIDEHGASAGKRKRSSDDEAGRVTDKILIGWRTKLQKLVKGKSKESLTASALSDFSTTLGQIEEVADELSFNQLQRTELGRVVNFLTQMEDVPHNDENKLVERAMRLDAMWSGTVHSLINGEE